MQLLDIFKSREEFEKKNMSVTIRVRGQTQTLEAGHNKEHFEEVACLFKMFDDTLIEHFEPWIPPVTTELHFYHNHAIECYFDVFMMACYVGNKALADRLARQNSHFSWNTQYKFGLMESITPTELLDLMSSGGGSSGDVKEETH